MQGSRELDKFIAREIFGHVVLYNKKGELREQVPNGQERPLRPYSTDMSAAWDIAQKLGISLIPVEEGWFGLIGPRPQWRSPAEFLEYLSQANFAGSGAAVADKASLAICLAAVRAVEGRTAIQLDDTPADPTQTLQ